MADNPNNTMPPNEPYVIPEEWRKKMEELRKRIELRREKAQEIERLRNTPEYLQAMEMLSKDLGSTEEIPEITFTIPAEIIAEIAACQAE